MLAPGVARASDAWLAARRLRRVVRGGVVWLERGGEGTPWLVLHGVAGLFCSQYDALARALGAGRPVRVPLHPNLGDATDFAAASSRSIAGFALSIAAALDGPVDLLAVSIGTSVAAALMRHGQVRRAIYVDPVAFAPCGADAWRLFFERPLAVARTLRRRRLRLAGQRKPYSFEHEARAFLFVPPAAIVDVLYALMCCSDVVRVVCRVHSYGRCTEACLPPLAHRPPTLVLVDEDDALTCAAEHVDHFEAFPRTTVVRARGFHGTWLLNPRLVAAVASWTAQVDADEAAVDAILAPHASARDEHCVYSCILSTTRSRCSSVSCSRKSDAGVLTSGHCWCSARSAPPDGHAEKHGVASASTSSSIEGARPNLKLHDSVS